MKYPNRIDRICCRIGIHEWYFGFYSFPVWGRGERHCLSCGKKQFRSFNPHKWITF